MVGLIIAIVVILAVMYLFMFINIKNRNKNRNEIDNVSHYRDTYIKRRDDAHDRQINAARRKNYVAKTNQTLDYMEKEKPENKNLGE